MRLVSSKVRELVLMGSPAKLAENLAGLQKTAKPVNAEAIARQLADLDRKIAAGAERLLDVEPSLVPSVRSAMRKLQERREALASQVAAARIQQKAQSPKEIAARIWKLASVLESGDIQEKQAALAEVVDRIELTFARSERDRRKWLPVGGTVFFFRYQWGKYLLERIPPIGSAGEPQSAPLLPSDFS